MINVPLLRKTLEHITKNPEEHEQGAWAIRGLPTQCGTAFCLAGHAVQFAGHQIDWGNEVEEAADSIVGGGSIQDVAQRELGLEGWQAGALFFSANTRRALWQIASEITHGEIEVPDELDGEED